MSIPKVYSDHQQEKFMSIRKTKLKITINDKIFDLIYEPINVEKAAELDYKSYNKDGFSSFFEMRNMVDCVQFKIFENDTIFYDSECPDKNLEFNLVKTIYDAIRDSFCMNKEEIEIFSKECEEYLKSQTTELKMPYELLLARNILNGTINLSLSDFENMEIKKYEKIQLALSILQKQVNESEIE